MPSSFLWAFAKSFPQTDDASSPGISFSSATYKAKLMPIPPARMEQAGWCRSLSRVRLAVVYSAAERFRMFYSRNSMNNAPGTGLKQ